MNGLTSLPVAPTDIISMNWKTLAAADETWDDLLE